MTGTAHPAPAAPQQPDPSPDLPVPQQAGSRSPSSRRGLRRPVGRRTPSFVALLAIVTMLVLLGTVMGLSATAAPSLANSDSAWAMFRSQGLWVVAGTVAMLVLLRVDYHHWRKLAAVGLGLALVLLVLTALPSWGISSNGARRWLALGPLSFQPSEAAKLPFVIYVASLLSRPSRPISDARATVHPVILLTAAYVVLQMLQPHLGSSILIVGIAMAMLFFAGASLVRLSAVSIAAAAAASLMIAITPWRRARLGAFFDPWSDPLDSAYQPLRSLYALASGGIKGMGMGAGRSKWGFLPDAHTDFIFAVIGEELGMGGTFFVVLAFASFAGVGMSIAVCAPDRFGMLLAWGITSWIALQAGLNIGAVLGVFPVVGMTLPLLSFGGSSVVSTLAAVGVLLNVARQSR